MTEAYRTSSPPDFALQIEHVSKKFDNTMALTDVSFDVPRNAIYGLLGPNGAGKTTLFSLIASFLKPTSGRITVLGIDVQQISDLRGKLAILPQDAQFQANVPVLEQLVFFCQLSGFSRKDAEQEAMRALSIVGLADIARKNARILSHGMAKRLGIAQAFLGKPEVILLDEPTAGLDPVNAHQIRQIIREFPRVGTLVISSHDLREIQEMCSHVAILDRGKLVEQNSVQNITQAGRKVRMTYARPLTDEELTMVMSVNGVKGVSGGMPGEYIIDTDPAAAGRTQEDLVADIVGKLAAKGLVPKAVQEGESLESHFLKRTGART